MTSDSAAEAGGRQPYVLVVLRRGGAGDDDAVNADHERFITELIRRNIILLGGSFDEAAGDAEAAYLLRCSLEEARAIASQDPFVERDVMRADCVEWRLVGINPDAIDTPTIIRPRDV